MPGNIVANLGDKVAEQWSAQLLTPAFVFWAGGLALWCKRGGNFGRFRYALEHEHEIDLIALCVLGILLVAVSAVAVQPFEGVTIRVLEGYHWPKWLRKRVVGHLKTRLHELLRKFQKLSAKKESGALTYEESKELIRAERGLAAIPPLETDWMPTELGNILRAAEKRIVAKYGLDPIVCWPRLWLILPDGAKKDFADSRAGLNAGARTCLWSIAFIFAWTAVSWLAAVIGIACAAAAYFWTREAARGYAAILEAAFDVYRTPLYGAVRRDMAKNASEEHAAGSAVTEYLRQGSDNPAFVFSCTSTDQHCSGP